MWSNQLNFFQFYCCHSALAVHKNNILAVLNVAKVLFVPHFAERRFAFWNNILCQKSYKQNETVIVIMLLQSLRMYP